MRYAPEPNLFFMHIPKCAGSSVIKAMQDWSRLPHGELSADLGSELPHGVSRGPELYFEHPEAGPLHLNHVPLRTLREHFPQTFALIKAAECFAILRDPRERFLSATSQYLREFGGVGPSHIDDDKIRAAAREVVAQLRQRDYFADRKYIHFTPQNWFVEDTAGGISMRLFSMEQIDALSAWLGDRAGRQVTIPNDNATVQPKSSYAGLHALMRGASRMVPFAIRNRVVPYVLRLPIYNRSWKQMEFAFDPEIEDFITRYYARDFALFASLNG